MIEFKIPEDSPEEHAEVREIVAHWQGAFTGRMHALLRAADKHMNPELLTDDEKFAICWSANVPIEYKLDENNMLIAATVDPCGVSVSDGQWLVFRMS